ncbi:hypothetical protein BZA70DRAFT_280671 [Myxozyma melibiosi]|uniref:Polynucleotide 5'-hydroxyl-kinase GRC3 n=1 Tax=Myxozyma melibiosi TaxID=54550 RepID=A0ABR1F3I6_9ASCO
MKRVQSAKAFLASAASAKKLRAEPTPSDTPSRTRSAYSVQQSIQPPPPPPTAPTDNSNDDIQYAPILDSDDDTTQDCVITYDPVISADPADPDLDKVIINYSDSDDDDPKVTSEIINLDQNIQLSMFAPSSDNLIHSQHLSLYALAHSETLVIQGQYSVRVLKGTLSLYGASLTPSSTFHQVFAPTSSALPILSARITDDDNNIDNSNLISEIKSLLPKHTRPTTAQLQPLLQRPCIIAVKSTHTGIEGIDRIIGNGSSIWTPSNKQPDSEESHSILYTATQHDCPLLLSLSAAWNTQITKLTKLVINGADSRDTRHPRILICGPKGVGKSTFLRLLLNSLASASSSKNKVTPAVLDLDPGQPEFAPAGILSVCVRDEPVFGPSLSHCSMGGLAKASHFGYISPRESTADYIRHTEILEDYYSNHILRSTAPAPLSSLDDEEETESLVESEEEDYTPAPQQETQTPLLINTSGWIKGDGVRVLKEVITTTKPDIIVYIGPTLPRPGQVDLNSELAEMLYDTVGIDDKGRVGSRLKMLQPFKAQDTGGERPRLALRFTAADLRNAQTMSYFHAVGSCAWDFEQPLTEKVPYVIPYAGLKDCAHVVEILQQEECEELLYEHVLSAINGTIVGISSMTMAKEIVRPVSVGDGLPDLPMTTTPTLSSREASSLDCIGLGILRAIDHRKGLLQILVPRHVADSARAAVKRGAMIVFARGRLSLPLHAAWDGRSGKQVVAGVPLAKVPYLTADEEGAEVQQIAGGQALRVRRNVLRKNQQR